MKFKEHRATLDESLITQIEVNSLEDILNHLKKSELLKPIEIKLKYYGYDNRINWDTYLVLCRYEGLDGIYVAGMTNGLLK